MRTSTPSIRFYSSRTIATRLVLSTLSLLAAMATSVSGLTAQDVEGSADHPLVSRFGGSTIIGYRAVEFDEFRLAEKPIHGYRGGDRLLDAAAALDDQNSIRLEGKVTRITYEAPEDASTLQVYRSYERALQKAGFGTVFSCTDLECAAPLPEGSSCVCGNRKSLFSAAIMHGTGYRLSGQIYEDQRFLAARLSRPEGDVFVSLFVTQLKKPLVQLDVIEVEPLEEGLVTVDAAALARELEARGSVDLYGIYFDTGLSVVKPESQPALTQIAKLMRNDPALRLYVVGHTDDTGAFGDNLDLSLQRAEAVVEALVSEHEIERSRLLAKGVGPLAPVASNTSEEGRAQNRRVALVAAR